MSFGLRTLGSLGVACCMVASGLPPVIEPGVENAVRRGTTRVILELRVPGGTRPEGELAGAAAVEAQRRAIVGVQAEILARLAGNSLTVIRRYARVPFLALELDAAALRLLRGMGDLVLRVFEDRAMPLAPGESPSPDRGPDQ